MRTQEPCAGRRRSHAPPHACDLFTLKQVFGSLWFATCPCARGTTDRSVSARRSLELNNKGDYPFIQSLRCGLCLASRLRFGHSTDASLNFFRPDVQRSKHPDPEGLVGAFDTNAPAHPLRERFGGCGVHIAQWSRCLRSQRSRIEAALPAV